MKSRLNDYNRKRNFNKTPEPKGKIVKAKKQLVFCIQHHIARKDHYDFRLEMDGVLKSWAVPKGPSLNPKDKRLAVRVEDHPFSYRTFEGNIPKGEYGAGTVMLFDKGTYELIDDFNEKAFKFILYGKRFKGKWTLVHFKEDNWLLIKEKDEFVDSNFDISKINKSIKTERTMKEIKEGKKKIDIKITNPDKVIFDKEKITKKDLINYYEKVAFRMLPLIENRLISVIRAPEGMNGGSFFKKHLENKNRGIGKKILPNEEGKKEDYYYIKDINGLISEVQMNSYEFHIWGSKVKSLNNPDMMVFDLDPDENLSLKKLREGVKDLKSILDELSLPSYLKTSGGKGYHIVVPIKIKMSWKEFRDVAKNIAELMEAKWSDKYVTNVRKEKRKNKIFIDWIRNSKSSTFVAPYSVRLRKNAPVSMPIKWSELDKVKPNEITINEALKRIKRKDPWEGFNS